MKTNLKSRSASSKKALVPPNKILFLDLNEKTSPPPVELVHFLKKFSFDSVAYTRGAQMLKLKEKIARYNKLSSKNVVIFPGSFGALVSTFSFINTSGGEILSPVPTFPFYESQEKFQQLKIRKIVVNDSQKVAEEIIPKISKLTTSVYLVNPGNPFGELFPVKEIEKIILALAKKNKYLVVDEAYSEYANQTVASLLKKYKNLIVVKTFSKAFGLSGLRLGYILANPDLALKLENLRGPSYTVSNLSIQAGLWSLDNIEVVKKYVNQVSEAKKALTVFLELIGVEFKPSYTNFVAIKVSDSELISKKLGQQGVLVKNLSGYPDGGDQTKNWIRITIPDKRDLPRLIKILTKVMDEFKAES